MSESGASIRPKRLALVVHPHRPIARELAVVVEQWWSDRGVDVITDISHDGPSGRIFSEDVDVAISLGGDGTMLRTVALAAPQGIPVLGVNLGNLGYLTSVEPEELTNAFELLDSGNFVIEERMMLDVSITTVRGEERSTKDFVAMNEVVVEKTSAGHTVRLACAIGDDQFLTYAADGMMVATPTGSTAYNLSLRGPLVSPRLRALVMTPIAPHMLFDRTLIIEPELTVHFELLPERPAEAVVDGDRIVELRPGDTIAVCEAAHPARIVKFGDRSFYKILHSKFGLLDH